MNWLKSLFSRKLLAEKKHPLAGKSFRSNEAFFEYYSTHGDTKLEKGKPSYAVVVSDKTDSASRIFGEPIKDPLQRVFLIHVASRNFDVMQHVAHDQRKGIIKEGDLVAWIPVQKLNFGKDKWDGALIALCAPEFGDHGVKVITYF